MRIRLRSTPSMPSATLRAMNGRATNPTATIGPRNPVPKMTSAITAYVSPGMLPAATTPSWKKDFQYRDLPIRYPTGTPSSTASPNPRNVLVIDEVKSLMNSPDEMSFHISFHTLRGPGRVYWSSTTFDTNTQMPRKPTQPRITPEIRRTLGAADLVAFS
jgi:hypothetical protein